MLRVILRMLRMARMAPSSSCAESKEKEKEKEDDNFEGAVRQEGLDLLSIVPVLYYLQLYRTAYATVLVQYYE